LHAINSVENRLEYLKAKHGNKAPTAQEARKLRDRLRDAACDDRVRLLRVFQRMDKINEAPAWLREQ
ncbi:MAG: hypothetical protein N3A66_01515, partial [Planctomycetota bacterium]|nr:hypothetical protein [Planctomycetota bacterium]